MPVLNWILSQLLSYSLGMWLAFIFMAWITARMLGLPGIFLGHIMIAIAVACLDVQWIQSEMRKPEWNGLPDQDFVFMIGVIVRIVLINTVLLPVSILAMRQRRRSGRNALRRRQGKL